MTLSSIESLSLDEAAVLLGDKLDLNETLESTVTDHVRWGYVEAMIQSGKLDDADEYKGLFKKVRLNAQDIRRVALDIQQGVTYVPIFDAGLLSPLQQWQALFEDTSIPTWSGSYAYSNLNSIRRATPANAVNAGFSLINMINASRRAQSQSFSNVYSQASPDTQPAGPRVIFTTKEVDLTRVGVSATQSMINLAINGDHTLDISTGFLLFRKQIDEGLRGNAGVRGVNFDAMSDEEYAEFMKLCIKDESLGAHMPENRIHHAIHNGIFPNGNVPTIYFDRNEKEVCIFDNLPFHGYDHYRNISRSAFGELF